MAPMASSAATGFSVVPRFSALMKRPNAPAAASATEASTLQQKRQRSGKIFTSTSRGSVEAWSMLGSTRTDPIRAYALGGVTRKACDAGHNAPSSVLVVRIFAVLVTPACLAPARPR